MGERRGYDDTQNSPTPLHGDLLCPYELAEARMERASLILFLTIFPRPPRSLDYQAYATRKSLPPCLSSHVLRNPVNLHLLGLCDTGEIASISTVVYSRHAPIHFPSLPRARIGNHLQINLCCLPPNMKSNLDAWPLFPGHCFGPHTSPKMNREFSPRMLLSTFPEDVAFPSHTGLYWDRFFSSILYFLPQVHPSALHLLSKTEMHRSYSDLS